MRETSGPVVGQRAGGSVGTSALLAELYFTFFLFWERVWHLNLQGVPQFWCLGVSTLLGECVRGMCKRAWYGEEMLKKEVDTG